MKSCFLKRILCALKCSCFVAIYMINSVLDGYRHSQSNFHQISFCVKIISLLLCLFHFVMLMLTFLSYVRYMNYILIKQRKSIFKHWLLDDASTQLRRHWNFALYKLDAAADDICLKRLAMNVQEIFILTSFSVVIAWKL